MDPLADFEDQSFSHDLIEQNRQALAAEARDFVQRAGVPRRRPPTPSPSPSSGPTASAALDNLPSGEVAATLPVLAAMKGGFRFGEVGHAVT